MTATQKTNARDRAFDASHNVRRKSTAASQTIRARVAEVIRSSPTVSQARKKSAKRRNTNPRAPARSTPPGKSQRLVALLKRSTGASLNELMDASGWQAHSVRGFLSGTVKKRMGLSVESAVDQKGVRRYRIGS